MYIMMDMGTSNTRLWLARGTEILASRRAGFGAGMGRREGREKLFASVRELISELLQDADVDASDIECVMASGMAESEFGLFEVPHIPLPADHAVLCANLAQTYLPTVAPFRFVFVPGLKKQGADGSVLDIMRGEETEAMGILQNAGIDGAGVLVLPGSHNKILLFEAGGTVTDFATTLSGELLAAILSGTILSASASHDFALDPDALLGGAAYARENGLNAALFQVRVMERNNTTHDARSSFLYGAVIGGECDLIRKMANGRPIYVGGRAGLRNAYVTLLGEGACGLDEACCADAVRSGLASVYAAAIAEH